MSSSIYVYYRVSLSHAASLREAALAMQAALACRLGVAAALKRRPEDKNGIQTWMEVYEEVPAGFEAELAKAVADAGLEQWINGPRHAEYFQDA